MGSGFYNYVKIGEIFSEGNFIIEGIGNSWIIKNMENVLIDDVIWVDDKEVVRVVY